MSVMYRGLNRFVLEYGCIQEWIGSPNFGGFFFKGAPKNKIADLKKRSLNKNWKGCPCPNRSADQKKKGNYGGGGSTRLLYGPPN
jgi:hypothetical protein